MGGDPPPLYPSRRCATAIGNMGNFNPTQQKDAADKSSAGLTGLWRKSIDLNKLAAQNGVLEVEQVHPC